MEGVNESTSQSVDNQSVLLTNRSPEKKQSLMGVWIALVLLFVGTLGGLVYTGVTFSQKVDDVQVNTDNISTLQVAQKETTTRQDTFYQEQIEQGALLKSNIDHVTWLEQQNDLKSDQISLLQDQIVLMQNQISELTNSTTLLNSTVIDIQGEQTQLSTAASLQRTDVMGNYTAVFGEQFDMSPNQTYFRSLTPEVLQDLYISQISWSGGNETFPIISCLQFGLSNTAQSTKFIAGSDQPCENFMNLSEIQGIKSVNTGFANYFKFNKEGEVNDSVIVELDFFADDVTQPVLSIGNDGAADFFAKTGALASNIVAAQVTMQQYATAGTQQYGFKTIQFSAIDNAIFGQKVKKNYSI